MALIEDVSYYNNRQIQLVQELSYIGTSPTIYQVYALILNLTHKIKKNKNEGIFHGLLRRIEASRFFWKENLSSNRKMRWVTRQKATYFPLIKWGEGASRRNLSTIQKMGK